MTPIVKNFGQGRKREGIRPDMSWKDLTKAGNIYEPGNAKSYQTNLDTGSLHTLFFMLALLP